MTASVASQRFILTSRYLAWLGSSLDVKRYPRQTEGVPADEVDRLITAWGRERPDLDLAPLAVLSRVTRLARHLERVRTQAFGTAGLETWEFDVLAALRRTGEPYVLSPGQLVARTRVTSGTMTNRIDRLEHRGLVQRLPDPEDRRGVHVRLTPAGSDHVDLALQALLRRERQILAAVAPDRAARLADLLRDLMQPFEDGADTR